MIPLALLACSLGDSLPYRPLLDADSGRLAYTVAQYMDTAVVRWRYAGEVVAAIEDPSAGQVLVLIVPLAGEGQGTGVDELPVADEYPVIAPGSSDGWCGRLFSWTWPFGAREE